MRFEFESDTRQTIIRAIFEGEDSFEGARQEGPGTKITYSGRDIVFDYPVESMHPDLLGLLCLIIFYPFIGGEVTFPQAVSPRLVKAFEPAMFKTRLRFTNVDDSVEMYSGSKMALSFGGGIDSTAVRELLPEAFIVHEAHIRDGQVMPSRSVEIVQEMGPEQGRVVLTNQRYVSQPGGWHGWTCSTATSLLLATDFDFGIILTGSNLGSTLLWNGSKYFDRFAARTHHGFTGNFWQSAFNTVGIPMFSPVCGVSEFLTMKLSLKALDAGQVVYCMADKGDACFKCLKCFRRDVIRTMVASGSSVDWVPYDRAKVHEHLENRPLHFGHLYSYVRDRGPSLPRFVMSRVKDLPAIKSDWPMKVHPGTFEFCADQWRNMISDRVMQRLESMQPNEVEELQSWDQSLLQSRAGTTRGFISDVANRLRLIIRSQRT